MMTESTDAEEFLRDWREKILFRLGDGSLKKWRSYSEFGQIEIEYLEFVLDILYCNSKFNSVIFELDVFRFTVKGAYEDREELMLMRYKTLYGYIIRCESSYFCPLQTDFQRLVSFVKWRRHVIGSYCYFHFKIKDSDWSGYPTSHFVTMRQFCSDYLKAKSGKERLINMSHFFYFLSRFMDIMTVHRRYLCTRAEE